MRRYADDSQGSGFGPALGWIFALGLVLAALATRAYGLSDWALEADEYYTYFEAEERMRQPLNTAYYVLTWASFELFGVSEWSSRLPAMLLGALGIPLLFWMWRRLLGSYAAAIAAVLTLVSSWHIWYSQFARFYSAVFLFGVVSYAWFLSAMRTGRMRTLVLAIAANAVGFAFHATSVLVPVSCGAFALVVLCWKRISAAGYSRRIATTYLVFYVFAGLAILPFLWTVLSSWKSSGQAWGYSGPALILQISKYVQVAVSVAALIGVLNMLRRDAALGLYFLCSIAIPMLALLVAAPFVAVRPDYMFYSLPMIYLAAGSLCEDARSRGSSIARYALPLVILASMLPEMASHYTGRASLHVRDTVAFIDSSYRPGDRVLPLVNGFDLYSDGRYSTLERPGGIRDGGVDWEAALENLRDGRGRLWIVVPAKRARLAPNLENWLYSHAALAWRKFEKRFDYTVNGYEVYVAPPRAADAG